MPTFPRTSATVAVSFFAAITAVSTSAGERTDRWGGHEWREDSIQVGSRPYYLVEGMDDSALKRKLKSCEDKPVRRTDFSIAHRGAPLQFPEHTQESYEAGARMGAGIVECDVTFTADGALVCRHAQNDLHTTTNILTSQYAIAASCHSRRQRSMRSGNVHEGGDCRVPYIRAHARRVQEPARQDGRIQSRRPHGTAVPGRHSLVAH